MRRHVTCLVPAPCLEGHVGTGGVLGLGDKAGDDALGAGFLEIDGQLVALDFGHMAIAEFLMEDTGADLESGKRLGIDGNTFPGACLACAMLTAPLAHTPPAGRI